MKQVLIGIGLAVGLIGAAHAAVNCNSFPNNTVNSFVNDDVVAEGYTCTIASTGTGNVTVSVSAGVSFKGNSEHELAGSCSNTIVDFQGAACTLL